MIDIDRLSRPKPQSSQRTPRTFLGGLGGYRLHWFTRTLLLLTVCGLAGCSSKKKSIGLDVDVFLHASSSDPSDVMLQAGIGKRLDTSEAAKSGTIHVRVVDGVVTLSGTVRNETGKTEAERIARETEMTLNGAPIRPAGAIRNQLTVER